MTALDKNIAAASNEQQAHQGGMWAEAEQRIRGVCKKMGLSKGWTDAVVGSERELKLRVTITDDQGELRSFNGYRVQHNSARGPYKGGIRYHPSVTMDETRALAALMSLKCSVAGIPYGGGKGGLQCDPTKMSRREVKEVTREFATLMAPFIGPMIDIPAPDVNTNSEIIAWMTEAVSKVYGQMSPGTFTGKPLTFWGSAGRDSATGVGVAVALQRYVEHLGDSLEGKTVAVQGYGKVGRWSAHDLRRRGAKIIGISDVSCGYYNSDEGVNLEAVDAKLAEYPGCLLEEYEGSDVQPIDNEALLALDADILVPAALEDQIRADNADNIKAKLIAEGANGPVTPEADAILESKGIVVLPDILANAGGVIVSYFEWVQALQGFFWEADEIANRLDLIMSKAMVDVIECADRTKSSMRDAAMYVAIEKIVESMKVRGLG